MSGRLTVWLEGLEGSLAIAGLALLSPLARPWYRCWGATDAEVQRAWPGDIYVPHPQAALTCAITIEAPAEAVWPWFVQLGCQRAGWYSYDLLDNGGVPSADSILPQYQQLAVGDVVKAVPDGSFGFPVVELEPERWLILAGTINSETGESAGADVSQLKAYFSGSQSFIIEPLTDRRSRLIFRMRLAWNPAFVNTLVYRFLVEPISFVMGRKMLLKVKRRAEALAHG